MELDNLFTYGVDLSTIETKELRDATSYNLTTGTVSKSLAGDNFPVRDFPTGTTDTLGLFVQDEISHLAGGPFVHHSRCALRLAQTQAGCRCIGAGRFGSE